MALDKFQPYLFVSAGEQSNKYLTPVISPGGIASFQAQRAQDLAGLTIRIDPVQSGTGDPSPDNIRPISGRTGMTVTMAGRNIAQINNINIPALVGSQSTVDISSPVTLSSGTYTLSWTFTGNVTQTRNQPLYAINNVQTYSNTNCSTSGRYSWTFTLASDATLTFRWWANNLSAACSATDFMLEFGDTAHEYAAYVAPTTYPISWQTEAGTVYGGTLDVVSGVLTVDRAGVDMGTLAWRYFTSGDYFYVPVEGKAFGNQNVISSIYATSSGSATSQMTDYQIKGHATSNTVYVKDSRYTAAEDLISALSGQTMVYELATPQTYQLTPTEVRTILGYNQIYSDAGPVIDIKF